MVCHDHVLLQDTAVGRLVAEVAHLHADALAVALAEHLLGLHVDELILQGRAAGVDDQNFHVPTSFVVFFRVFPDPLVPAGRGSYNKGRRKAYNRLF